MSNPLNSFSEIAARLFADLRQRGDRGSALSLLVTSTAPGEGKSFVAEGLAVHLAALGSHSVMLCDTNLARPTLTGRHKLTGKPGLSELLAGGTAQTSASSTPNLALVGIGAAARPMLLFRDGAIDRFVEWGSSHCDLLVLDGGALSDPGMSLVAARTSRVLLVVDSLSTPRGKALDAIQQAGLRSRDCSVILNKRRSYLPSFVERLF